MRNTECKRNPNTKCLNCDKDIYKRPNEIVNGNTYCSVDCYIAKRNVRKFICQWCGREYKPYKKDSKFCSRTCANHGRNGIKYTKDSRGSKSRKRLEELRKLFTFNTCMIEGCTYSRCYDVHRFIEGKNGGKYEVGNMFAICPNHHREIHKKLIEIEKVNDFTLKIIKDNDLFSD